MIYKILLLTTLNLILQAQVSSDILPCLQRDNKSQELIAAALNNDIKTVSELAKIPGININDIMSDGQTALMIAVENQNLLLVRLLIESGAGVNYKTKYYEDTALIIAVRKNNLDIINFLLSSGANINITNRLGQSALDVTWTEEARELLSAHNSQSCFPAHSSCSII